MCRNLALAVDAHLSARFEDADAYFRAADCPNVWGWVNPAWSRAELNVRVRKPEGDTRPVALALRDPLRHPDPIVRTVVLARDGHRCRYCGIPVVSADIRKLAHRLYPEAVRWNARDAAMQHAGFQCLWLQYDHVVPHSHGGRSTADNIVVCCALCNFGKDRFTLLQLGVEDPRPRPPLPVDWDGLERFRVVAIGLPRLARTRPKPASPRTASKTGQTQTYFLPGARISKGYVLAPSVQGKDRWFRLEAGVEAVTAAHGSVKGVLLTCAPRLIRRRGIDPEGIPAHRDISTS